MIFKPSKGFAGKMAKDAGTRGVLEVHAAAVAEAARQNAPGDQGRTVTIARDRETVSVGFASSIGHLIEWGSKNNPAYAPLRRAVRAAGLRLVEQGKKKN